MAAKLTVELELDPFAMDLFGGSPKTATYASETYIGGTIARRSRNARAISLSAPEINSSFAQRRETQRSRGGTRSSDAMVNWGSNATSSATRDRTYRRSLSDRLTPSLISRGLVCGITPSSTRKQSGQPILVLAFDTPVGLDAGKPPRGFSCSSAHDGRQSLSLKPEDGR